MRKSKYIISFFIVSIMLVIVYFVFYHYGANMGNDNIRLKEEEYVQNPIISNEETVYAGTNEEPVISAYTVCIKEYEDDKSGVRTEESVFTPDYFGLNRDEYINTLKENEILLSFNSDKVAVRVANKPKKPKEYQYYLILENNQISVYKSDKKTLYFNTQIHIDELNNYEISELTQGIFIEDVDELYSFLESHTS